MIIPQESSFVWHSGAFLNSSTTKREEAFSFDYVIVPKYIFEVDFSALLV